MLKSLTTRAAVVILGKLINYLQGVHMNLSDRLNQIGGLIRSAAPHLASAAAEAESVVEALAPTVAAALPGTGAANVATELAAAAAVAQQVQGAVVGAVTSNGAPTPGTASSTPVSVAQVAPASTTEADATAAAVAGVTAQAAATSASQETRLQLLETALSEMLPALASVLKMFGK